jgi:hypothetical protein
MASGMVSGHQMALAGQLSAPVQHSAAFLHNVGARWMQVPRLKNKQKQRLLDRRAGQRETAGAVNVTPDGTPIVEPDEVVADASHPPPPGARQWTSGPPGSGGPTEGPGPGPHGFTGYGTPRTTSPAATATGMYGQTSNFPRTMADVHAEYEQKNTNIQKAWGPGDEIDWSKVKGQPGNTWLTNEAP